MAPTPVVVLHAVAAFLVLALGPVNLLRRRRDSAHRVLGRIWVGLMVVTCASSYFIHPDGFSWLHGLSTITLFAVGMAIFDIRRGHVQGHRLSMIGAYVGTWIAFIFAAAIPTRLVGRMVVNSPIEALALAGLLGGFAAVLAAAVIGGQQRARP